MSKTKNLGSGWNFKKRTHCNYGHPFSEENTWYVSYNGEPHRRCKTCYRRRQNEYHDRLKQEIIAAYGGKCCWHEGCDVSDPDMLVVDHVNDDGVEDRKRPDGKQFLGSAMYKKIKKAGFPDRYQILCANHNLKKELLRKREERGQ